MDKNINIEESNGDDIKSQCALLSFSCRVGNMIDLTPDEWEISFKSIEKRVSYLISAKDKEVLLEVCDLVIQFIPQHIMKQSHQSKPQEIIQIIIIFNYPLFKY